MPDKKLASAHWQMKFGLRFKFLVLVSLLFIVLMSGLAFYLVKSGEHNLRDNLEREAKSFAALSSRPIGEIFTLYISSGTSKIDQQVSDSISLDSVVDNISVVDLSGKVLYSKNGRLSTPVAPSKASDFTPTIVFGSNGTISQIIYPYFEISGAHRYSIVYDISSNEIEQQVRKQARGVIVFASAALLVAIVTTYIVVNFVLLRPIRKVSTQAELISAGMLENEIKVDGNDEIAKLGESVNKMADSLKDDISKLRQLDEMKSEFMMIVSHNLRTPLTIIKGYLSNSDVMTNIEEYQEAFTRIQDSANKLGVFSEDILTISRLELGEEGEHQDNIDIAKLGRDLVKEFSLSAQASNRKFSWEIPDETLIVSANRSQIRTAIWNILDNALKFTKAEGAIHLQITGVDSSIKISIADDGIGIEDNEIAKVFTKFHRGTSTLQYDYEGTGIGLYATKLIVEQHHGEIALESKPGSGTKVTITLPMLNQLVNQTDINTQSH